MNQPHWRWMRSCPSILPMLKSCCVVSQSWGFTWKHRVTGIVPAECLPNKGGEGGSKRDLSPTSFQLFFHLVNKQAYSMPGTRRYRNAQLPVQPSQTNENGAMISKNSVELSGSWNRLNHGNLFNLCVFRVTPELVSRKEPSLSSLTLAWPGVLRLLQESSSVRARSQSSPGLLSLGPLPLSTEQLSFISNDPGILEGSEWQPGNEKSCLWCEPTTGCWTPHSLLRHLAWPSHFFSIAPFVKRGCFFPIL